MRQRIHKRKKYWLLSGLCVFAIYSTLSVVWEIYNALKDYVRVDLCMNLILAGALCGILALAVKERLWRSWKKAMALVGLMLTYIISASFIAYPVEKFHFLEYGILSYFFFEALAVDVKPFKAAAGSLVLTSLVGLGDEVIQYFLPNRYFQWSDVGLNVYSGILGLCSTWVYKSKW